MNEPCDLNPSMKLGTIPSDSRGAADLTTDVQIRDSGSTIGSDAGADSPARDLPEVPGYRVLREIARGGMGRVLGAFDLGLERNVALKVLLPGATVDRFVARVEDHRPAAAPGHPTGSRPGDAG